MVVCQAESRAKKCKKGRKRGTGTVLLYYSLLISPGPTRGRADPWSYQ
jgi:hypothetical protein